MFNLLYKPLYIFGPGLINTTVGECNTYIYTCSSHDLRIPRSVESVRECVFVRLSHPTLPDPNTGVGVPVSSRVSTKIQQLLNTLKRPKRPPLSEFFMDDQEEIVEGIQINSVLAISQTHSERMVQ